MPTSSNPKIAIGIASRGYDIIPPLVGFIVDTMTKYEIELIINSCGFSAAISQEVVFQNALCRGCDYLLLVDTDVTPPGNALDVLLSCNKDIVSAPVWHYNAGLGVIHLNATRKLNELTFKENTSGVEEVETTSFGCILISKKVLDAFKEAGESFVYWSKLLDEKYNNNVISSDTIFYFKAKKLGFPTYVCWDLKGCEHFTRVNLSSRMLGVFLDNLGVERKP